MAPLPRAYEEAQNGVAQACSEGEPKLIGQGVQVDSLMQCSADLKNRLEEEVVKPLKHWYAAYKNIVVRRTARVRPCLVWVALGLRRASHAATHRARSMPARGGDTGACRTA